MAYYLTYDLGTTALKTALISADGRLAAAATREYTPRSPAPGQAEMEPEVYWQAVVETTRQVFAQAGGEVLAVGFSSQGQTFIPLDRHGRPLYPAILWLDLRAREVAAEWQARWLSPARFQRMCGYAYLPAELTVFKIAWLREHHPPAHRAWKFLFLPDYILYLLTGETVTDPVLARMGGLFSLERNDWDPDLLAAAGVQREQLPAVLPPGSIAGRLTAQAAEALGLTPGIPVCTGCNDQLAGGIGAGNVRAGIISETTGTALAVIATTPALPDDPRLVVGTHAVPGLYYAMSFSNTSAVLLTWLREVCGRAGEDFADFLSGVGRIPPGSDGLTVLPHFAGTPADPAARGAFVGLTLSHTRDHLARAIMEACACLLREHVEPFEALFTVDGVRSMGGAARSDLWLQLKADLLGLPVERPACPQPANLGAAMLAAVGTGRFAHLAEAAAAWYRPAAVFTPDPTRWEIYQGVYARYRSYSQRLYGL